MIWLGRDGWSVEFIKNRPILNLLRWLLHTSVFKSVFHQKTWKRFDDGLRHMSQCRSSSNIKSCCQQPRGDVQ